MILNPTVCVSGAGASVKYRNSVGNLRHQGKGKGKEKKEKILESGHSAKEEQSGGIIGRLP